MLSWLSSLLQSFLQAIIDSIFFVFNWVSSLVASIAIWFWDNLILFWGWCVDQFVWVFSEFMILAKNSVITFISSFGTVFGYDTDWYQVELLYINVNSFFPMSEFLTGVFFLVGVWVSVKVWILTARLTLFIITVGQA